MFGLYILFLTHTTTTTYMYTSDVIYSHIYVILDSASYDVSVNCTGEYIIGLVAR